jgi:PAS domain S-box-containing protein
MEPSPGPSSAWLKALFDSTTDLIWSVDPVRFGLVSWNRAVEEFYARVLHRPVGLGLTAHDLGPGVPGFEDDWVRRYRRALDEGPFTEVYGSIDRSIVLELQIAPILEGGTVTGISVFGRDISAQVQAQQSLRESEQWLRALFDQSADAIFLNDLDGRVHRVNAEACRRLGYTADELTRLRVFDFQAPESRPVDEEKMARLAAEGHLLTEVTHMARDGTRIPTEVHSRVVEVDGVKRVLSVARDLTVRRRIQEAFAESQRRYEVLFENSGTANAIFTPECRALLVNKTYGDLVGRAPDDLVGRTVEEIFGPATGSEFRRRAEEVMADGKTRFYVTNLPAGGKDRWFQSSYCVLRGEDQRTLGVQTVSQDITEHHQLTERVAQTEKLDSVGVLAGGIAHDFNNLLAGLSGHLELARLNLAQGKADQALQRLDKAAGVFDRTKALTRQLLTFSKGGTPVRKLQNLGPSLKEWAEFALSGSDLGLQLDLAPDLWPCECDANQISQVLDNLLINARQVSPPGGRVLVQAANVPGEGPQVRISVTDEGPGIDPQIRQKIFDPFFTTKTKGTGLGLSVSQSIVRQHHGRIEVESTPGRGATFSVFLPASPAHDPVPGVVEPDQYLGSGWALVMDDEESLRDTLGEMLASLGFTVLRARDGHDALAHFADAADRGHPVRLALLDLTVPGGMGGVETARKLRASGSSAVLVAVSGYSEASGQPDLKAEFDGVLAKPFPRADLARLLNNLLRG